MKRRTSHKGRPKLAPTGDSCQSDSLGSASRCSQHSPVPEVLVL